MPRALHAIRRFARHPTLCAPPDALWPPTRDLALSHGVALGLVDGSFLSLDFTLVYIVYGLSPFLSSPPFSPARSKGSVACSSPHTSLLTRALESSGYIELVFFTPTLPLSLFLLDSCCSVSCITRLRRLELGPGPGAPPPPRSRERAVATRSEFIRPLAQSHG